MGDLHLLHAELRTSDLTNLIAACTQAELAVRDMHEYLKQLAAFAPERACIRRL